MEGDCEDEAPDTVKEWLEGLRRRHEAFLQDLEASSVRELLQENAQLKRQLALADAAGVRRAMSLEPSKRGARAAEDERRPRRSQPLRQQVSWAVPQARQPTVQQTRSAMLASWGPPRDQHRRRLCRLLHLPPSARSHTELTAEALHSALRSRLPEDVGVPEVQGFVRRAVQLLRGKTRRSGGPPALTLDSLLELVCNERLREELAQQKDAAAREIVGILMLRTAEDVVDAVVPVSDDQDTPQRRKSLHMNGLAARGHDHNFVKLNTLVCFFVILDLVALGVSADYWADSTFWLALNTITTLFFCTEACLKLRWLGLHEYFRGEAWRWNLCDLGICLVTVVELSVNYVTSPQVGLGKSLDDGWTKVLRGTVLLRTLRFVRVIRLMKVVNSPLLRDFANMLIGLVIGVPGLFWVLVLILVSVTGVGIALRIALGPPAGVSYIARCGKRPDFVNVADALDAALVAAGVCPLHKMYGEEFFGTTAKSMFSVFRMMLGDFTTAQGKSMVLFFSNGFGLKFEVPFAMFMIVVIFGLFNIITAVFVEGTVTGLKTNDVKRRYLAQRETRQLKLKLSELLERASVYVRELRSEAQMVAQKTGSDDLPEDIGSLTVDVNEWSLIVEDPRVRSLLSDLDVGLFDPTSLFPTADSEDCGRVSLESLMEAIVKVRGEAQKTDVIANWLSTRKLHMKLDVLFEAFILQGGHVGHGVHGSFSEGFAVEGRKSESKSLGEWQAMIQAAGLLHQGEEASEDAASGSGREELYGL